MSPAKMQQVLEINLISAQGLKPPSTPRRRFQTYALTWIDSATKLRTRVDKIGGTNPTWNDKFLFRVTPELLESETSGVSVAIYAVGTFKDHLIGTVRFLISSILSSPAEASRAPCFTAAQIRRPSGRFHGVMNIGAMVVDASDFPVLDKISAIGYRDLMGMKIQKSRKKKHAAAPAEPESKHAEAAADEVSSDSCGESFEEAESTTSSSSLSPKTTAAEVAAAAAALKEWNGVRELAGNKGLAGSGFLCCLVARRDMQPLSPTTKSAMER